MDAYFSYWLSKEGNKPSQFVLDMNEISVYLAKQQFDKVHFITDSRSLKYFEHIPFDTVSTELDELDPAYYRVWALGKLLTYKLAAERGKPFIHIDYDVFLWKPLPDFIFNAGIFATWLEERSYDIYNIPRFLQFCKNPHLIGNVQPENAVNAGIFGGNDLEFLRTYADSALKLVLDPENKFYWCSDDSKDKYHWQKSVICEQYYLEVCRIHHNKDIKMLFKREWPLQDEAARAGFTHMMGAKYVPDMDKKIKIIKEKLINNYYNRYEYDMRDFGVNSHLI